MRRPARRSALRSAATGTVIWAVSAALAAGCSDTRGIAEQRFEPSRAGQLTVATSLPAPGFWQGSGIDDLTGGFEFAIASALADRFDLELKVIDVPFERIVAGDLGDADLALAQITETHEREDALAFSTPYYADDAGAVIRAGEELTDLKTAREQRWAVQRGTVEEDLLDDTIRPDTDPLLVDSAVAAVDAVAAGKVDAALVDLSTALVLTNGRDDVTTGARFIIGEPMAIALPRDSPNVPVVDAGINALEADGTLEDLAEKWLEPAFATDPDSIPVVRTPTS